MFHKIRYDLRISWLIHQIADAMLRTGEGASLDVTDGCSEDFLAHGTRNKGIRFTVDNENGNLGIGNGLRRIGFPQTETTIQPCTQYQERFHQL